MPTRFYLQHAEIFTIVHDNFIKVGHQTGSSDQAEYVLKGLCIDDIQKDTYMAAPHKSSITYRLIGTPACKHRT